MQPQNKLSMMRISIVVVVCLAIFLILFSTGTPQSAQAQGNVSEPQQNVIVSISGGQLAFDATENVIIHVTISNPNDFSVGVLRWYTPVDGIKEPLFTVIQGDKPAAYLGAIYKRPVPTEQDYLYIGAGESLTYEVDITNYYDLSVSGSYTIKYSVTSPDLYLLNQKETGSVISNSLALSIAGRPNPVPPKIVHQSVSGSNSFTNCSTSQQADLTNARTNASIYATGAVSYLYSNKQGSRYTTWFGAFDSTRYSTVDSHFDSISNAIDTASISYDCGCTDSAYAWVYAWWPYNINICNAFWPASMTGTDSKAGVLIHELSHFWVVASTDDHEYGQFDSQALAISDPDLAIDNADNHEYFAENNPALEPPPSHDDFDARLTVANIPYADAQDTTNASTASDDPTFSCVSGQKSNTVWYQYIPTATQVVSVDTFGSNYDTVLAVWNGSRGSLTSLSCSDDAQDNSGSYTAQSKVVFTATAGTTYYIEAASYFSGSGGSLTLHAALANDDFDTPEVIGSNSYSQTQDTSAASTAADDPVFPCGSTDTGSNSVWYRYTPSENGTLLATTINSNYDTMLAVWTGSRGSLSNVACNDDYSGLQSQVTSDLTAGVTYYIEVAGFGAGTPSLLSSHKLDQMGDRAPATDLKSVASGTLNLGVSFTPSGTVCGGGSNSSLFTSSDNEDNIISGNGDCDMDTYLYNTDSLAPIEFNISVPSAAGLTSAELLLLNYDVDEDAGEVDEVYFNGHYAGTLTGANGIWSTTVLTLDPAWVVQGNNLVQIYIDVSNAGWAVTTDWGQLLLNGQAGGTAYVDTMTLNKTAYAPGETVHVTADVDTSLISQNVRTEINLRNSSGIILEGMVINHAVSGSTDDPVSADLVIPASSSVGSYNIQVLVYDSGTNLIQDSKVVAFDVKNPTVTFRSTATQDGWILESTETSNAGGTMNSTATSFNIGDGVGDKQYRAILSFNTANLPDTAVVTRATLRIRVYGVLVGNNTPFTWGQGLRVDVCKGTFGTSVLQLTDFNFNNATNCKLLAGTFGNTPVNGWYTVNLISTARPKISLTGLTQFRLRFYKDDNDDNAADYWRFYSGNYATATLRPTLIIEYYIP